MNTPAPAPAPTSPPGTFTAHVDFRRLCAEVDRVPAALFFDGGLPGSNFRRECKLIWRSASDIGIKFVHTPAQNRSDQ
jgi:hypothetical protein